MTDWINKDGKTFWEQRFPNDNSASVETLTEALLDYLQEDSMQISQEFLMSIVQLVIAGKSEVDEVSKEDFDYFLCRFGSLNTCIPRVCKSLFDVYGILHPWYHGKIGKDEALSMVKASENGTFLVRISENKLKLLAVTYVRNGKVENSYIYTIPGGGFTMSQKSYEAGKKEYDHLMEVIDERKSSFCIPYPSVLHSQSAQEMDKTDKRNHFIARRDPLAQSRTVTLNRTQTASNTAVSNYDVIGGGTDGAPKAHRQPSDDNKIPEGNGYDLVGANGAPATRAAARGARSRKGVSGHDEEPAEAAADGGNYDTITRIGSGSKGSVRGPRRLQSNDDSGDSELGRDSKHDAAVSRRRQKMDKGIDEDAEPSGDGNYDSVRRTRGTRRVGRQGSNTDVVRQMSNDEDLTSSSAFDVPSLSSSRALKNSRKLVSEDSSTDSNYEVAGSRGHRKPASSVRARRVHNDYNNDE